MENLRITISIEELRLMMADLILSQKETDKKFQESEKRFQETEKLLSSKFLETDKKFQESEKRFQETEKLLSSKFLETDKKFQEMVKEIGGIGKSNGAYAEDFFYSSLENSMKVGKLQFDYVDMNIKRKRNNTEAEYDIILYNHYKVLVIEVKYNFKVDQLRTFYKERLKKYRTLFPEHKEYKLYGGVAALTFDKKALEEAKKYGFYILTQNNETIKIVNEIDFEPTEIK